MYSEKVMDHFKKPRNVGELENADGVSSFLPLDAVRQSPFQAWFRRWPKENLSKKPNR